MKHMSTSQEAMRKWGYIPEAARCRILESTWCSNCRTGITMEFKSLEIKGGNILLAGTCPACGKAVARLWDPEE